MAPADFTEEEREHSPAAASTDLHHTASPAVTPARSADLIMEELPEAYKNVDEVIEVVHHAGLARKVARLRPMGVIKG